MNCSLEYIFRVANKVGGYGMWRFLALNSCQDYLYKNRNIKNEKISICILLYFVFFYKPAL